MGWTLLSGMMPGSMKMLLVTDFRQYSHCKKKKTAFQLPKCLPPASLIPLFVPRLSPQAKCRTPSTAEDRLSGAAQ
jgi:hypothetical protein